MGLGKTSTCSLLSQKCYAVPQNFRSIPPSILLIVYGALSQTSVTALFITGIIPVVLIGLMQMGYAYYYAFKRNIGPIDNELLGLSKTAELSKLVALKKSIFPLGLFLVVIVGIMAGIFTATEAASIAVMYVLFVAYFIKDEMQLSLLEFVDRLLVSNHP